MFTLWDFNYSKRLLVKESSQDTIQLEWNYLDVILKQKNGSQINSSTADSVVLTLPVLMSKRACSHAQFHFVLKVVNVHTTTSDINFKIPN